MKLNTKFGTGFVDAIKVPIAFSIIRNKARFRQLLLDCVTCSIILDIFSFGLQASSVLEPRVLFLTRSFSHNESGLLLLQSAKFVSSYKKVLHRIVLSLLLRSLDLTGLSAGTSYNGRSGLYSCSSRFRSSMHFQLTITKLG